MTTSQARKPLVGEVVETPQGEGFVVSVLTFEEHPRSGSHDFGAKLRARLGRDYAQIYFEAEVEVDGKIVEFACWDLDYDAQRDPTEAPWRETPGD